MIERQKSTFEEIVQETSKCEEGGICLSLLAVLLHVDHRTLEAKVKEETACLSINRNYLVPKKVALQLSEKHKPSIEGWKTAREIALESGADSKTLKWLLRQGKIAGKKDLCGFWRVPDSEKDKIIEINNAIKRGVIEQYGKKFYSIAKAARDAASLITRQGTPEFAKENRRLNKRFQRQVYETLIGQIGFSGKYYVPEEVYRAMIKPSTLGIGKRTEFKKEKKNKAKEKPKQALPPAISSGLKPLSTPISAPKNLKKEYPPLIQKKPVVQKKPEPPMTYANQDIPPLFYDPDNPPKLKICSIGRRIRYYNYIGRIVGFELSDTYRPQIRVEFPTEQHELMKYHNLIVGRN
jgi:hypothetical protein